MDLIRNALIVVVDLAMNAFIRSKIFGLSKQIR